MHIYIHLKTTSILLEGSVIMIASKLCLFLGINTRNNTNDKITSHDQFTNFKDIGSITSFYRNAIRIYVIIDTQ